MLLPSYRVLRRIVGTALEEEGEDAYRGYAFTVANATKDMRYIVEMDSELGLTDSALNETVLGIFDEAVEEGLGDLLISELLALEPHLRRPNKL